MTFGMMFGSNQNIVEEWSTDDDGDGEYDDDDDDEDDDCDDEDDDCEDDEEYLPDEYFDEYAAVGSAAFPVHLPMPAHPNPYANSSVDARVAAQTKMLGGEVAWEPQVKQYSNMNLKDQLNMQRQQIQHGDLADDDSDPGGGEAGDNNNGEELTEAEKERKQKLAKKRAEKRRKQKEKEKKKARDASPEDGAEGEGDEYRRAGKYNLDFSDLSAEELAGYVTLLSSLVGI